MSTASESNGHLAPLLEGIERLIGAGVVPDENTVRTLLLAAGRDPSPEAVRELLHRSYLLRWLKGPPSAGLHDAVFETLTQRGLSPELADAVLDSLSAAPSIPAAAAHRQVAGEIIRTPGSTLGKALPPTGRTWTHRPHLDLSGVHRAADAVATAFRSGLLPVLLLGTILRAWLATTQSAWVDEAQTLQYWASLPLNTLFRTIEYDVHPPLYYALLHIWIAFTGFGVIQARLLSVVFGLATIVALYLLADLLFDRATALCAALLLAVSPIAIWYSDEIRMYASSGFFALLTVYLLLRAVKEPRKRWWVGYAGCAVLAVSFDSSGAYLPLAVNLFYGVLVSRREAPLRPWLASNFLAVLLTLPIWLLLRVQLTNHGVASLGWIPVPTVSIVWSSALDLISLNGDRDWAGPVLIGLLIASGVGLLYECQNRYFRRVYLLLTLMIVTPFAVPLTAGLLHPVFLTRTVQTAALGLLILLARGIVLMLRIRIFAGVFAFAAIAGLNATSLHTAAATTLKEDWKGLARYASGHIHPGSMVVMDPVWLDSPFNLYWQPFHRRVAEHSSPPITSEPLAVQVLRGYDSVWLITYYVYNVDHPPIDAATEFLREHYRLATTTRFYGLTLYHYVARGSAHWTSSVTVPDHVRAVPDHVKDGSSTLIQVHTFSGAVCTLKIVYDTDHGATGWFGAAQSPDGDGVVAWRVQVVTKASAGTATAPCVLGGRTVRGTVRLYVAH